MRGAMTLVFGRPLGIKEQGGADSPDGGSHGGVRRGRCMGEAGASERHLDLTLNFSTKSNSRRNPSPV